MSYTAILDLLICAEEFDEKSSVNNYLEFLDENVHELINLGKIQPSQKSELNQLFVDINEFFNSEFNVLNEIASNNKWIKIRNQAIKILIFFNIEIISPIEFIDKYNWEDGEKWDGKTGCY